MSKEYRLEEINIDEVGVFEDSYGNKVDVEVVDESIKKIEDFFKSKSIFDVRISATETEVTDEGTVRAKIKTSLAIKEGAGGVLDSLINTSVMIDEYYESQNVKEDEAESKE